MPKLRSKEEQGQLDKFLKEFAAQSTHIAEMVRDTGKYDAKYIGKIREALAELFHTTRNYELQLEIQEERDL